MLHTVLLSAAIAVAGFAPAAGAAASTAPAADPPTVVLVHGAFADAASWNPVVHALQRRSVRVVAVDIPLTSLADDVAATRRAIDAVPGKVVLVGHSWGGTVITQAGASDKVGALVYVAAFAPDVGQSTADQGKGFPTPPGLSRLQERDGSLWLSEAGVREDFAQDLRGKQAQRLFANQRPIRANAFLEPVTAAAWHAKPSWYLVSRKDRMIAPQLQTATARRIGATLESIGSSHASPLSEPAQVADTILQAAGVKQAEPDPLAGG